MRENIGIFRGKRKDNGKWIEGFFTCATDCCGRSYFIDVPRKDPDDSNHRYEVDSETVCEFTGLTDKHGVKIFEGDIAEYDDRVRMSVIGVVALRNGAWVLTCGKHNYFLYVTRNDTKVIGNIHDDPEMLGAGKANT